MSHRQSLGNFEPYRLQNINKEKIFEQPKRNRTPLQRQLQQQIPFNKNPNVNLMNNMDNMWRENEDDIIKFQTSPDLNLEKKYDFIDAFSQSTGYFGSVDERLNQVKNIILIVQQRDQFSKSPKNRIKIISKSPIQNYNPSNMFYKVSSCFLEPFDTKGYEDYKQLKIKIKYIEKWECFAPDCTQKNQVYRIKKQDEIYILKGDNNKAFYSQEQIVEKIKQHLIAQSLLKLYLSILKQYNIQLPQTQFQYSNILIFEQINASQLWIAERSQNLPLKNYNDTLGYIYKDSENDINSDFLNTFSYFTFMQSNKKFLILNIQGQGSLLTQPEFILIDRRSIRTVFFQNYAKKIGEPNFKLYIDSHFNEL